MFRASSFSLSEFVGNFYAFDNGFRQITRALGSIMDLQFQKRESIMIVYADVVFIANFIATSVLFMCCQALFNSRIKPLRLLASGVVSGVYAVFEAVLLLPVIMRPGVLILLTVIVFGKNRVLFNTSRIAFVCAGFEVIFMLVMSVTGADAVITNGSVTVFCSNVCGTVVYFASYPMLILIKRYAKTSTSRKHAEFVINGQKTTVELLYDSGNLLSYKGFCVAVIGWEKMKDFFCNMEYSELLITAQDRMIFNTVGRGGILPIITPERSIIDGMESDLKIAVADRTFKGYDGIIGELKMKGMDKKCSSLKILQNDLFA